MKKVRTASTIMLARDHNETLEVLLLKRNKALAFAGGLWVFPGGKIEAEDLAESKDELEAAKLAAVRETIEEANVKIAPEDLIFFRHWTTPEIEPRRYATYFFFAGANHHKSEIIIDDSEIKDHLWINPKLAIEQFRNKNLAMLPPTLMSLQLISDCKTVAEVREKLSKEQPIYTLPVLHLIGKTMVCMYEGDAGYSTGNAEAEGARHRLTLKVTGGDFLFEFKDCEKVLPINGGIW